MFKNIGNNFNYRQKWADVTLTVLWLEEISDLGLLGWFFWFYHLFCNY